MSVFDTVYDSLPHVMEFLDLDASVSGSDGESETLPASSGPSSPTPLPNPSPVEGYQPAFRINARRFLLTYPHYNETPDRVLEILNLKKPIQRGIACLELHQDGEPHVHAAIEFATRLNSVNRRWFDIDGHHPNIQVSRSWARCVNYCRKEGTLEVGFVGAATANDLIRDDDFNNVIGTGLSADPFRIAEAAESYRHWVRWCITNRISSTYCSTIWDIVRGSHAPTLEENEPLPASVTDVQLRTFGWADAVRTLVVCGPSGIGKTSWARANAPTPSLIVTDIDDLKSYDPHRHRSIIFDEIRCTGARDHNGRWVGAWPLQSQIKLVTWDHPVSIRIRYTLARIPAHVPKVFTCTDTICFTYDEQVNRRIQILNLYQDRDIAALWDV